MTVDDASPAAGALEGESRDTDVQATARELIAGLLAEPWGQVSPSVYETGRLVTLAPWLAGHSRRLEFLITSARADGGWGGPGGYAIVPTLSAIEAILTTLRRSSSGATPGEGIRNAGTPPPFTTAELVGAADRGLFLLSRLLPDLAASAVPDMPALDMVVNSMIDTINRHLDAVPRSTDALAATGSAGLTRLSFNGRLRAPAGVGDERLAMIKSAVATGGHLPEKILHALEVVGTAARGHPAIRPQPTGTIGASPAATAAWLDERKALDPRNPARLFLERAVTRHGGLVPCAIPITIFERAWVLSTLGRAGFALTVPAEMVTEFEASLGPDGTPAAAGLPRDADTTSVALHALGMLGMTRPPDSLWAFETETHFCTWRGEEGFSVTVNAHVLDAFGHYLRFISQSGTGRNGDTSRYAATVDKVTRLLVDRQLPGGCWQDRWHASPFYATMCCALALDDFGGPAAAYAVRRARKWILTAQRPDGSWGLWDGTSEETAYALQILLLTTSEPEVPQEAIARGHEFLRGAVCGPGADDIGRPALWHDKDLYHPEAIVRSATLAALRLADRHTAEHGGS